jgi:hypothetical protein
MGFFDSINKAVQSVVQPVQRLGTRAVRLATTNPVVAPILRTYERKVPAPVRSFVNPRLNPLSKFHDIAGANAFLFAPNEQTSAALYLTSLINPLTGTIAGLSQLGGDTPIDPAARGRSMRTSPNRDRLAAAYSRGYAPALLSRYPAASQPGFVAPGQFTIKQPPSPPPPAATGDSRTFDSSSSNPVDRNTVQQGVSLPRSPRIPSEVSPIPMAAYQAAVTTGVASDTVAPADLYRAQEYYGNLLGQSGELVQRLKNVGGAAGMTDEALAAWAKQNPDLAYREMYKREKRVRDLQAAAEPTGVAFSGTLGGEQLGQLF